MQVSSGGDTSMVRLFLTGVAIVSLATPVAHAQEAAVVEWYHGGLNHYFVTSSLTEETAILNGDVGPGWSRTGRAFVASGSAGSAKAPVCRFFGTAAIGSNGQRIGPNSHFYTADAGECQYVITGWPQLGRDGLMHPAWQLETPNAFYVHSLSGVGFAAGLIPVTRFYNNGLGGNPNHRYTVDNDVVAQMRGQDWKQEGAVFCAARYRYPTESPWPFGRLVTTAQPTAYPSPQPWGQTVLDTSIAGVGTIDLDYLKLVCKVDGIDQAIDEDQYSELGVEGVWGGEWDRAAWFTNGAPQLSTNISATPTAAGAQFSVTRSDRIYHWWTRKWPRVTPPIGVSDCYTEMRFLASPGVIVQAGLDWYDSATGSRNTEAMVSRWAAGSGGWQILRVGRD
jgi:hypothetical protein